jgi:RNA polymerase sigma-70 factor, ECF subfamily
MMSLGGIEMGRQESAVWPSRHRTEDVPPRGPDVGQLKVDRSLMVRVQEGDQVAFRHLVDRYWPALVTYASGLLGRGSDPEDVVQEVFIRVWRSRSDWSQTGAVNAYLYRITRNLALNARRDHAAELKRRERGAEGQPFPAPFRNPYEDFETMTLREEVQVALVQLPIRRREVFTLSRFHGLSYQEIAEAMGIAPQTVANQMTAALAELRRLLSHHLDERA